MRYAVIAPHPDDELIGCYSLIKNGEVKRVIYIKNENSRMEEAKKMCARYKLDMRVVEGLEDLRTYLKPGFVYLVPSGEERHPLHRLVGSYATHICLDKGLDIGYYSTDMTAPFVKALDTKTSNGKKEALCLNYPSQKLLWLIDWRYFLFEGVVRRVV